MYTVSEATYALRNVLIVATVFTRSFNIFSLENLILSESTDNVSDNVTDNFHTEANGNFQL